MKKMILGVMIFLLSISPTYCMEEIDAQFDLKPGFYSIDDPGLEKLWDFLGKANVEISLSGHNGISIPDQDKWDITLQELKQIIANVKQKDIAEIMLEKNYFDEKLHKEITSLLKEEGFKEIIIVGAHSAGTFLEEYIKNVEELPIRQ